MIFTTCNCFQTFMIETVIFLHYKTLFIQYRVIFTAERRNIEIEWRKLLILRKTDLQAIQEK